MDGTTLSNRSIAAQKRWARHRAEIIKDAREDFDRIGHDPLFASGISLYWGEGDSKIGNPPRLSNTNPRMIAVYVRFLRVVMGIPDNKIRIGLILYPDLSDGECKLFWSGTMRLPIENFMKTQFIQGHHPTKRLAYGVCMVVVNSRAAKLKMLTWIDFFARQYIINP
jgi:hypothetical protein